MSVKNIARWVVLWVGFSIVSLVHAESESAITPVGDWTMLDPGTKEPQAIIRIWEDKDHVVFGKVIRIYNPEKNKTVCADCPEDFKNKPITGMEILWGLKQASDYTWNDGSILSPKRGKVFACNLTLSQDGQTLTVRVYAGATPILGKTQTWYRAA